MSEQSTSSTPKKIREWKQNFLAALRDTGNVRLSAKHAGIDRTTAYKAYHSDEEFRRQWDSSIDDAIDTLEGVARQRAMATSDTLLIFLLKAHRPEKYREKYDAKVAVSGTIDQHVEYGLDDKLVERMKNDGQLSRAFSQILQRLNASGEDTSGRPDASGQSGDEPEPSAS